jgi:hypothetical protein
MATTLLEMTVRTYSEKEVLLFITAFHLRLIIELTLAKISKPVSQEICPLPNLPPPPGTYLEIIFPNQKKMLVCSIYRPPPPNTEIQQF